MIVRSNEAVRIESLCFADILVECDRTAGKFRLLCAALCFFTSNHSKWCVKVESGLETWISNLVIKSYLFCEFVSVSVGCALFILCICGLHSCVFTRTDHDALHTQPSLHC